MPSWEDEEPERPLDAVFRMMSRDEHGKSDPLKYDALRRAPLFHVLRDADEWIKIVEEMKQR